MDVLQTLEIAAPDPAEGANPRKRSRISDLFESADYFDTISDLASNDSPITAGQTPLASPPDPAIDYEKYIIAKTRQSDNLVPPGETKVQLEAIIKQSNSDFISFTDQFKTSIENLRAVSLRLKQLHHRNIKFARNFMRFEIAYHLHSQIFYELEIERCRKNIDNCASFLEFLVKKEKSMRQTNPLKTSQTNPQKTSQANQQKTSQTNQQKNRKGNQQKNNQGNPNLGFQQGKLAEVIELFYVDLPNFINQNILIQNNRLKVFLRENAILKQKIRSLTPSVLPNDPDDVISHYLDLSTKTGSIMNRFRVIIKEIRYPDLEVIAEAISDIEKVSPNEVIKVLFDCAWYFRSYPICDPFKLSRIPDTSLIIPKVFQPPFLDDEWNYMTFKELSASDWPLKPAVDELFDMMIITNPFDLAYKFYAIIQTIGKCVQRILIRQNKDSKHVDIDFDQLFVLMLISIFTSGLREIVAPMTYCYKFREFVMDDYTVQFATSHLEGLCMHIRQIDWNDVKNKSNKMLKEHAQEQPDPLLAKKK